jgi:hypothetical protein
LEVSPLPLPLHFQFLVRPSSLLSDRFNLSADPSDFPVFPVCPVVR